MNPSARHRTLLVRLGLLAAGLTAGLLAAEAVLRLGGLAPPVATISIGRFRLSPNPMLGYEPVPDFTYPGPYQRYYEYAGRSNSLGFRDREHPLEKTPGALRIVVLGDSVAMGLGIETTEEIFTGVLGSRLGELGHRVEVLNFGVAGYNTRQEVGILLDRGLAFAPDLVLLQYCHNDTERSDGEIVERLLERERQGGGVDRSLVTPWLQRSALFRLIALRLFAGTLEERRLERDAALGLLAGDTVPESFGLLADTAATHGFEVLVAVFPLFASYAEHEELFARHQRVEELSRRYGFHHLDLLEAFAACSLEGREPPLSYDVLHPSPRGHRCAGEAIARYLAGQGLV